MPIMEEMWFALSSANKFLNCLVSSVTRSLPFKFVPIGFVNGVDTALTLTPPLACAQAHPHRPCRNVPSLYNEGGLFKNLS
jgi:hypothetical protein